MIQNYINNEPCPLLIVFQKVSLPCMEALLHSIDGIDMLVGGEGWDDFQHCSDHRNDTVANPGVARSFVWSFITAVCLDSTGSSSRTAGKVRSESCGRKPHTYQNLVM